MSDDPLLPFIHVLAAFPPGSETMVRPAEPLPPEVQRDLDAQLKAIDESRAAATVSAQNYMVWR